MRASQNNYDRDCWEQLQNPGGLRVGVCISNTFLLQEHALSTTVWDGLIQLVWGGGPRFIDPWDSDVQLKLTSPSLWAGVQHG